MTVDKRDLPGDQHPESDDQLRQRAEFELHDADVGKTHTHVDPDIVRTLHELQVHEVELRMQNEELLRTRAALETALAQYTELYDFAPTGYLTVNREIAVLQSNLAAARLLFTNRTTLVGRHLTNMVAAADRSRVTAGVQRVFDDDTSMSVDVSTLPSLGAQRRLHLAGIRSTDGSSCRMAITDISESYTAALLLRESETRLTLATTSGHIGLWEWDVRSNAVQFSPEWKRQIGVLPDELMNEHSSWMDRIHPDDIGRTSDRLQRYVKSSEADFETEYRMRHRDGSYRHILCRAAVVPNANSARDRLVGTHIDITERVRLEEQFLQVQKMETVGQLAGGIAHDFNNLLTVINVTAELAISSLDDDDHTRNDFIEIIRAGNRAAGLTRQLLAFSRKQMMQPEEIDLGALIDDMSGMCRRLIGETIDLQVSRSTETEGVFIDPSQLEQVVMNLVVNARDAMPDGGTLWISTSVVNSAPPDLAVLDGVRIGPYVRLEVRDSGSGMDAQTLARVFEPFYTTKGVGKGTGLGLSTVYGIMQQCNGGVQIASTVNEGTTVSAYMQRVNADGVVRLGTVVATPSTSTANILLVEDDALVRRLAKRILTEAGFMVHAAANGTEALEVLKLHASTIELLFTDVVMPGMSGWDLAKSVLVNYPRIKVVYTSGYSGEAKLPDSHSGTDLPFLGKPYTAASLLQTIRVVLDGRMPPTNPSR